ncbi:zinc finger MYM-type protein 1-like [Amblyraja radiata]|uniref:zinc finger MYM-type protein 1-like n=1 Tax=Amblyraja radiata TaxID=386614 RepID=UPI001402FE59|nr:zinc finger MYM-type protein 1-like [Amblyraja radiata]
MNKAKDPGLWDEFYGDDVTYWVACECQHHNGLFDKSCRNFISGKPKRYCSQKIFFGIKANGEHYKREWLLYSPSKGSVYCFVCKLFAPKGSTHFARNEGFSDWRNTAVIDNHEKSTTHRDAMLTYLTRKQGLGLTQPLEKQIEEEYNYWEDVLRCVVAVICTLAERGLAFRGKVEKFGSLNNGNYLGLLELISQFDPFLAAHISRYGNAGKGNPSYLSKMICEELIELMAKKVHSVIIDEINVSGYFSLSVDSTPDLSHVDQLSIVPRYLQDGQPVERFITFLELQNHTGEAMAQQVLKYLCDDCKLDFAKCRGQSYDNAANMSGRYNGMQQKLLDANQFAIYVPCAVHSLNLVGRSAVDCCQVVVDFFSTVQLLYTFFSASTARWRILKDCIGNEKVLKSLSDTRWEARAVATAAIINSSRFWKLWKIYQMTSCKKVTLEGRQRILQTRCKNWNLCSC